MGFYYNQPGFYYNQQPGFYYNQQVPEQQGFYYDGFYYEEQEDGFYYDGFYYEQPADQAVSKIRHWRILPNLNYVS